jgi:hypothetical protein
VAAYASPVVGIEENREADQRQIARINGDFDLERPLLACFHRLISAPPGDHFAIVSRVEPKTETRSNAAFPKVSRR